MKQISPRIRSSLAPINLLLLIGLSACAEALAPVQPGEEGSVDGGDGVAVLIERASPDSVVGTSSFPISEDVRVRAVDAEGSPKPGLTVQFRVESGGGSVTPVTATTDNDGYAATRWVLGASEGAQRLTATMDSGGTGATVGFTAMATFGAAARLEPLARGTGLMPVGCSIADPLRVRVLDANGNPVAGAPVLFVGAGGGLAEGIVVSADEQGIAASAWKVEAPSQVVDAKIARPDVSVSFDVRGVPVAPDGFATVGNRIYGSDCEEHRFYGVARPGLDSWPDDARLREAELANQEFDAMVDWGANVVRLPLYQRFWQRSFTYDGIAYEPAAYKALVRASVDRALAAGLAVILDLHNSDRGDPNFPALVAEIQQMADVDHSIPFWKDLAREYKDEGRVIFQLYTEPNQIDWSTWRDGGSIPGGQTIEGDDQSSGVAFEAAGMQDLYDAVRGEGADNLVLVNGMHWGYNLEGIPSFALDGYNIAYATHPYDYPDKQPDVWMEHWGFLTDEYPVIISEFGDYECNAEGYYTKVLDFADQRGLSWVAWAWWAPEADNQEAICGFPALITDWTGTPSPTGQVVRGRMQSYSSR